MVTALTDVAEQVRVSVRQMAATVRHRQTPAYYNQVLGRICLTGGDCSPRGAVEAWDRTKDTTSTAVLEAFAKRFTDTYYGDLAKARLAELMRAAAARKAEGDAKAEAERQRLVMLKAEDDRKRAAAEDTKRSQPFDGIWHVRRIGPGCALGQDVRFLIVVSDRVIQGVSSGQQTIHGSLSASGRITFRHATVDGKNNPDGRTAVHSGSFKGTGGSGTFAVDATRCRGTFAASRGQP